MGLVPTQHSIIGQFVNGRNAADDFLQLANNHGGTVFGWIDSDGHLQGSLLSGMGGTPGGSDTNVQFNNAGAFGGSSAFTFVATSGLTTLASASGNEVLNLVPNTGAGDQTSITALTNGTFQILPAVAGAAQLVLGQAGLQISAPGNNGATQIGFTGITSGSASLGVAAVAGTPNRINLPTATGTVGQVLITDGGSPQQLSWATTGTAIGIAGQSTFFNATNSVVGGTVELDMAGISGADLGAKMNNCATALPASGGTCKGDNLTGVLTLSTAVTTAKPVVYTFCGQIVTQTAAVTLINANSGVIGCAGASTIFTKGANIDQFTLSGAQTVVKYLRIAGAKGSFTGNGVVTATGATQATVEGNVITAQANDGIFDNSATFSVNTFIKNFIFSWGVHAFQSTSTSQQSLFTDNYALGDGTSTGAAILNGGSSTISNNYIKDSNGVVLVDDSTAAQGHPIIGNRLTQTNGWPAINFSTNSIVTNNTINAGGANGPGVTGQGTFTNNFVSTLNADCIDIVGGTSVVENNNVNMNISGVSNKCAINSTGDQISVRIANNTVSIGGALGTETNYGICDTPTGTHNLNVVIDGNNISTTLTPGAGAFGVFVNNAANLNTNWGVTVQNNSIVHPGTGTCLKRIDTQNNTTVYINNQPGDGSLDNGTGSTSDVFVIDNLRFAFASLPSPVGNGSHVYCTDCTQAKPTASGGAGAFVVREAGQWNGL